MAASEKFTELKQQVETAESNVRAAAAQDQAELRAKVDQARKDADERAGRLKANVQQAADQGDRQWSQAQSNWDQHVQRIRARVDERKAERDAKRLRAMEHRWAGWCACLGAIEERSIHVCLAIAESRGGALEAIL